MAYDPTKTIRAGVAVDAEDQAPTLVNGNGVYGQPKADARFNLIVRGGQASVWNNKTRSLILRITATTATFTLTFSGYAATTAITYSSNGTTMANAIQSAINGVTGGGLADVVVTSVYAASGLQIVTITSATVDLGVPLFTIATGSGTCKGGYTIGTAGKSVMKYRMFGVTTTDSITIYDGDPTAATIPTAFLAHSLAAGASVDVSVPLPAASVGWFYLQNCDVAMAGVGPVAGFEYA